MLLVCPNCTARYSVSPDSLGVAGRQVRCAKCEYKWFQAPDKPDDVEDILTPPEEKIEEVEDSIDFQDEDDDSANSPEVLENEDVDVIEEQNIPEEAEQDEQHSIPEGVKPIQESASSSYPVSLLNSSSKRPVGKLAKVSGVMTAILLFACLLLQGVFYKQTIVSKWPEAQAIYNLIGMPIVLKGEALVIESLTANLHEDVDGENFLSVEGRIINLTKDVQKVPKLLAQLRSTNGTDADSWEIDNTLKELQPGESFMFKSDYPAAPRGAGSVNLSFLPEALH